MIRIRSLSILAVASLLACDEKTTHQPDATQSHDATITTTPDAARDTLEEDRARVARGETVGEAERLPEIDLDDRGLLVNGALIVPANELRPDEMQRIGVLAKHLDTLSEHWQDVHENQRFVGRATFSIPARTNALLAMSILTSLDGWHEVVLSMDGDSMPLHIFARPSSPIPHEQFFLITPTTNGYSIAREQLDGDGYQGKVRCRSLSAARAAGSPWGLVKPARELCRAYQPDCVDHAVLAIARGKTLGDVRPWIIAATGLQDVRVHKGSIRVIAEGTEPFPKAVACNDAGIPLDASAP